MSEYKIRIAEIKDAEFLAKILREIGWSERRNSMKLDEVSKPIEQLIHDTKLNPQQNTIFVAVNQNDEVGGFINVHWFLLSCSEVMKDMFLMYL